ncbi:MAG TPA: FixH family protein [Desulfomonilaceae bacterium]|nr:FixH family protein [Desulfomonilaceae bacterium]
MRIITREASILVLLALICVTLTHARDYAVRRKADAYTVDIAINRNPPVTGKNEIRIEIKDPSGKYIAGVPVSVNYYMPPMPGMPPMNYTVNASPSGDGYSATMDLIMAGPWNIIIKTVVAGKQLKVATPIDVR